MPYHLQALIVGGGNNAVQLVESAGTPSPGAMEIPFRGICELFQIPQCVEHSYMGDVPVLRSCMVATPEASNDMQYVGTLSLIHAKFVNTLCESSASTDRDHACHRGLGPALIWITRTWGLSERCGAYIRFFDE